MAPKALFCNPKIANMRGIDLKNGSFSKKSLKSLHDEKECAIFAPAKRVKNNLSP